MDELFSCRNCVQNCGQTVNIGRGPGFCIRHNSVIRDPDVTTCKYLHRKDLPQFVVDEGIREHAAEFAVFPGMVHLHSHESIHHAQYSEKFAWENNIFDPITNVLAQYHKSQPAWVFIESLTSGVDGRRAIAHGCLVRRYMYNCDTWKSSYRLVLAFVQEIDEEPHFRGCDLMEFSGADTHHTEALWDLVFIRFSLIQEYGWHAGIESLIWVTDIAGDPLVNFDWPSLQCKLSDLKGKITENIIRHARDNGEFFNQQERLSCECA